MAEGFPEYPPRTALPDLTLHKSTIREDVNVTEVAEKWFSSFLKSVADKDAAALTGLLYQESWWRDLVALSWTITSKNGPNAIASFILGSEATFEQASVIAKSPLAPQLVDMGPMTFIQFGFAFSTQHGTGRGVVRLGNDGPYSWKAWTGSTQLDGLCDQPVLNDAASNGINGNAGNQGPNDYQVLIVGAGQSGVTLGAWLDELGIRYLIIDKEARPGDAWRQRYASVKAHTPIYMDHFPFLRFPSNWPKWLTRDHIADWIESYSRIMNLRALQNATVTGIHRDASTAKYKVNVALNNNDDDGSNNNGHIYTATHVVLATGVFPPIPHIPSFPGRSSFQGTAYHTVAHESASQIPDLASKKIALIGAGTSAHDIAQDFVRHGAKHVTMIQRSRIFAASTAVCEKLVFNLWDTPGVDTDTADLLGNSMPLAVGLTLSAGAAPVMAAHDADMIAGLERAGMTLAKGQDGIGLLDYQAVKVGHFYVDQGAAAMIMDGRIGIRRCRDGVREFNERGVVLADGTQVDADVVVLATGFKMMQETAERLLGAELASKASDPWARLDQETERPGLNRPTGVPGLWYFSGSFMMCRQFSKLLALQIAAIERGINKHHFATYT